MKQYRNTVQTIQNTVNTSTHITKTPTQLSNHPHITKQVTTTTVLYKIHTKWNSHYIMFFNFVHMSCIQRYFKSTSALSTGSCVLRLGKSFSVPVSGGCINISLFLHFIENERLYLPTCQNIVNVWKKFLHVLISISC